MGDLNYFLGQKSHDSHWKPVVVPILTLGTLALYFMYVVLNGFLQSDESTTIMAANHVLATCQVLSALNRECVPGESESESVFWVQSASCIGEMDPSHVYFILNFGKWRW